MLFILQSLETKLKKEIKQHLREKIISNNANIWFHFTRFCTRPGDGYDPALHSLAGSPCRCWPPSWSPHTAHWGRRSACPGAPRALCSPRAGRPGRRVKTEMEGRERAGRSAERQFLGANEDRSRGGWSAPGEKRSPEDLPHLEDTRG